MAVFTPVQMCTAAPVTSTLSTLYTAASGEIALVRTWVAHSSSVQDPRTLTYFTTLLGGGSGTILSVNLDADVDWRRNFFFTLNDGNGAGRHISAQTASLVTAKTSLSGYTWA